MKKTESKMPRCAAKTRGGGKCKQKAGWGTDHVGTGRCKLHGGCAGAPIKHGLYAKQFKSKQQKKLYEAAVNMKDWKDTSAEIAVLRSLVARLMKQLPDKDQESNHIKVQEVTEGLRKLLDTLGKNIERRFRAEEGLKVKFEVEVNFKFVHAIITVITQTVNLKIKDKKTALELNNSIAKQLTKVAESFCGADEAQVKSILSD